MTVFNKHIQINNLRDVQVLLITVTVSLLFLGYAFSSICLSIFIIYSIALFFIEKRKVIYKTNLLLLIFLYFFLTLTYFWSVDAQLTLTGSFRIISLFLIPITFLISPTFSKNELALILKIFTLSNIVFGIFFLTTATIRYLETGSLNEFTYHNLVESLELNAVYVSAYFSLSFFYLITMRNKKPIIWFLALFLLLNIFLLSSKTILFVLFIVGLVYFIKSFKNIDKILKKRWYIIVALFLVVTLVSRPIINRIVEETSSNFEEVLQKDKFNKIYPWTGSSFRLLQLRILKEQIEEEKIIFKGFGLFASRENLKKRHIRFNTYPGYHTYNYHNMYAQILSESGILGLFLLLVIIINFIRNAIKSKSTVYLFFGVLILIWFFSESVLWVHRGVIFFSVFYCLFTCTDFSTQKLKEN